MSLFNYIAWFLTFGYYSTPTSAPTILPHPTFKFSNDIKNFKFNKKNDSFIIVKKPLTSFDKLINELKENKNLKPTIYEKSIPVKHNTILDEIHNFKFKPKDL